MLYFQCRNIKTENNTLKMKSIYEANIKNYFFNYIYGCNLLFMWDNAMCYKNEFYKMKFSRLQWWRQIFSHMGKGINRLCTKEKLFISDI